MSSGAKKRKRIKGERAAKMASPPQLIPEVCDRIAANGGPTYRTTSQGHVCNQTGQRLKRGQCKSYTARVLNGTTAMLAFRQMSPGDGKKRKGVSYQTTAPPPSMKVLPWPGTMGYFRCPCCSHDTYVTTAGSHRCSYCDKTFKVELSVVNIKYRGYPCYHTCPHCSRSTWVNSPGISRCDECGKTFKVEY